MHASSVPLPSLILVNPPILLCSLCNSWVEVELLTSKLKWIFEAQIETVHRFCSNGSFNCAQGAFEAPQGFNSPSTISDEGKSTRKKKEWGISSEGETREVLLCFGLKRSLKWLRSCPRYKYNRPARIRRMGETSLILQLNEGREYNDALVTRARPSASPSFACHSYRNIQFLSLSSPARRGLDPDVSHFQRKLPASRETFSHIGCLS